MIKPEVLNRWTSENSEELYGIKNWGSGYFNINKKGEVAISPFLNSEKAQVSIMDVISGIKERGMDMPVLLRVENLLDSQISYINTAFKKAIDDQGYKGNFRGVYPIKVNQQQQVLEEVAKFGQRYHHGLEVGSKAELIAALSIMKDKEACLVCNGYKDEEFIDLGLHALKMGFQCFFVIEIPGELDLILKRAAILNIEPNVGVRIKLSSKAGGHWSESGGDRSIFGLNTSQLIDVVDQLKEKKKLHILKLLHYHLGSQIPNIRDIRSAVVEASRIYSELVKEGAPMGHLDLGGGLAVDYDGSKTNFQSSRNYTTDEYCSDIIEVVQTSMDESGIDHPTIITESGRSTVAYYSVLLFDVLDVAKFDTMSDAEPPKEDAHDSIKNLDEVLKAISVRKLQECYNDALFYRDEVRELFRHGKISLRERSQAESIFWKIMSSIVQCKSSLKQSPPELNEVESAISDIYYSNFSLFQSVPDSWAIDQLFPIMPLHRLKECPNRRGIIADITCDCDGKIDRFIDLHDVSTSLRLHELKEKEDYYLGVFLVGAYQETLGDLHNLFGDTNVVSIRIHPDGGFDFVREIEGDTVADVLSYVEYDPRQMLTSFRETAEEAIREKRITVKERTEIVKAYSQGLSGYTYFED